MTTAMAEADDALDRFEMTEAPELEVLFDVDEFFAHLVGLPVLARVRVESAEDADDGITARVGLRPVAIDGLRRDGVAVTREIT